MRPPALLAPLLAVGCGLNTLGVTDGAAQLSTGERPTAPTATGAVETQSTQVGMTDTPSTGAADNCELAPECAAGAVEDGAPCESCGFLRRTCQADCTWTPLACEQDLDSCAYWVLPSGQQAWERVPVDANASFAPQTTVLAAIGLAPQQQIYVLTADSFHVLSTATRTWIAAGPRDSIFPELAGTTLYHANGIPNSPPDTIVSIVAGTDGFSYTFIDAGQMFTLDAQVPCCGPNFMGPNAPDPYSVRDGWGQLGDPEGWLPNDVQALCGLDQPEQPYGYNVLIGDGLVYPQDLGYCFDFYAPIPFAQFTPFTFPGSPANDLIGGAAVVDGLWIFRGE